MVQFSRQTLGLPSDKPNIFRQASIVEEYEPSTGEVMDAYSGEAFYGVGTLDAVTDAGEVLKEKEFGKPITQEEYKVSPFYREDLAWEEGMTAASAKILAERRDDTVGRQFLIGKATGLQDVAGFGSAFGTGIVEPLNLSVGLVTSLGVGTAAKSFFGAAKIAAMTARYGKTAMLTGRAGVEGLVAATAQEPVNRYSASILRQDYTFADTAMNFATSVGLSSVIGFGGAKYSQIKGRKIRVKNEGIVSDISRIASEEGMDPNVALAITGIESSFRNVTNPKSGAFGYYQFMPETAKAYGITPESSFEAQTKAFIQLTKDNNASLESSLGRELTPTDTYLAHWLGAPTATKILQADRNASALAVFKQNGLFKGYEKKVLTQNGLSEKATVEDVIATTASRVEAGLRLAIDEKQVPSAFKYKTVDEKLKDLDTATRQMVEGKQVDIVPNEILRAKQAKDYESFFDNLPPERLAELESFKTEGLAEVKTIKEQIDELKNQRKTYRDELLNSREEPEFQKALIKTGYPVKEIKDIEAEMATMLETRLRQEKFLGKGKTGKRVFKEETKQLQEGFDKRIAAIKKRNEPKLRRALSESRIKKKETFAKVKELDKKIADLEPRATENYTKFSTALESKNTEQLRASALRENDPNNSAAIDKEAIAINNRVKERLSGPNAVTEAKQMLERLENEVALLEKTESLTPEAARAIEQLNDMPEAELVRFFQNAYGCLRRKV